MIWSGEGMVVLSADIPEIDAWFSLQPNPVIKIIVAIMKLRHRKWLALFLIYEGFAMKADIKKLL
jgi:hypothetical protein